MTVYRYTCRYCQLAKADGSASNQLICYERECRAKHVAQRNEELQATRRARRKLNPKKDGRSAQIGKVSDESADFIWRSKRVFNRDEWDAMCRLERRGGAPC